MARRKRKEDEPDWVPPEFDEVGYMRQEIQGAHAAIGEHRAMRAALGERDHHAGSPCHDRPDQVDPAARQIAAD